MWGDSDLAGRRFAVQEWARLEPPSSSLVEARAEVIVADSNERAVTNAVETYGVKGVDVEDIHTVDCDFYSPCALGGGLNETTIPGLNCQAIVGSANNQLAPPKTTPIASQPEESSTPRISWSMPAA